VAGQVGVNGIERAVECVLIGVYISCRVIYHREAVEKYILIEKIIRSSGQDAFNLILLNRR
jgi:hypothetical protein